MQSNVNNFFILFSLCYSCQIIVMLTFCYDFDSIATSPCFLSQGVSIDVKPVKGITIDFVHLNRDSAIQTSLMALTAHSIHLRLHSVRIPFPWLSPDSSGNRPLHPHCRVHPCYLCIDIYQVANLLRDFCTYGQLRLCSRNCFTELHIQLYSISAGL